MKKFALLLSAFSLAALLCLSSCDNHKQPQNPDNGDHTHSYTSAIFTKPATCTENGETRRICSCGEAEIDVIPATGHSFSSELISDEGFHWSKCKNCDEISEKEAHSYDAFGECIECKSIMPDTEGVLYEEYPDGNYAVVVGYVGSATDIKIAEEYNGYPVEDIDNYVFSGCDKITSIVLPKSMRSIGNYCFRGCTSLRYFGIPEGVTRIGAGAFENCDGISSFYVNEGNLKYSALDESLYNKDKSTLVRYAEGKNNTRFEIPDGVTTIGYGAFHGSDSLTSVIIPDSVTRIGECAFAYCERLISVDIPDNVMYIEDYAFLGCASLESATIGSSVTSVGNNAFASCTSITSIFIPKSVSSIGDCAFTSCYFLNSIEVDPGNEHYRSLNGNLYSKNMQTLIQYAIGKSDLSFKIPDGVTKIDNGAFSMCTSLKSIEIPESVIRIESNAFSAVYFLSDVYYGGSEEQWKLISIDSTNDYLLNATLHFAKSNDPGDEMPPEVDGGLGWG